MAVAHVQEQAVPTAGLEAGLQPPAQLQGHMRGHDLGRHPWRAVPVQLDIQLQVESCVCPPANMSQPLAFENGILKQHHHQKRSELLPPY